ncbi:hypothetical protein LTR05_004406 [Lithohypha guttulata]|uniref:Mannan endo-1,6-alpha-mannosidase n=1 Tax=Lithohypha guttulata TaxID=1690604 RepID=A0AAN7Y7Q0_9EURO|nr:hypothetical protein LTR05_004406 [Lithohypha guttulata]
MLVLLFAALTAAIQLNVQSDSDVKSVASTIAYDMMTVYTGNQSGQVPGLLPGGLNCNPNNIGTYCWWEAGAMFGALINYWQYTGDSSYNDVVSQALQWQKGADSNFNPANQSRSMGVDDQGFWAFSAMDAVEANFPEAGGNAPSWLSLAQAVYNFQLDLWDPDTCGGGFRWQVFAVNAGYNLKNAVSNGGNFQLAARLAYVTGNSSYADWANKVYDWMAQSKLMQVDDATGILYIWDNTDTNNNCIDQTNYVWTYNYGIMLAGAAYMYAYTNGEQVWLDRVNLILKSTFSLFFPAKYGGNVLYELQCEEALNCNEDQKSFKAYLSRWLAVTALLVPSTAAEINPKLLASAQGAAGQCDGGSTGRACGLQWWSTTWDGTTGVGQQMAALSAIGATLNRQDLVPLTTNTGATSKSDPNAGSTAAKDPTTEHSPITTGDKAGAAIFTIAIVILAIGGAIWIVL